MMDTEALVCVSAGARTRLRSGLDRRHYSDLVAMNFLVKSASCRTLCGVKRRQAYVEA